MEKYYYTISEVASILDENVSCVRYWSNSFSKFLDPHRNAKGNRLFKEEDIEVLKQIKHLLKNQGMTIEGAARQLSSDTAGVKRRLDAVESLRSIRAQLLEIKESL